MARAANHPLVKWAVFNTLLSAPPAGLRIILPVKVEYYLRERSVSYRFLVCYARLCTQPLHLHSFDSELPADRCILTRLSAPVIFHCCAASRNSTNWELSIIYRSWSNAAPGYQRVGASGILQTATISLKRGDSRKARIKTLSCVEILHALKSCCKGRQRRTLLHRPMIS
jgi:hypothetical protein